MVFGSLRASFNAKKRRRASTVLEAIPYDNTFETEVNNSKLKKTRSLRSILLPPISRFKPMTVSNFKAIGNESKVNMVTVVEDTEPATPAHFPGTPITGRSTPEPFQSTVTKVIIKRKPVGSADADPRRASYIPKFNPQAPRNDASMHKRAREALIKRYQSKFTYDFELWEGSNERDYDFLWVKKGELEKKILEDIIWVRERFAYARKDEPTDEDIIYWYDAELEDGEGWSMQGCEVEEGVLGGKVEAEEAMQKVAVEEVTQGDKR